MTHSPSAEAGLAPSKDACNWAVAAHLSGFAGYVIPFANVIAPLVIWLMKRDSMPFVADQAKEALNFQISFTVYMLVAGVLTLVFVGFFLAIALLALEVVLTVMAAVRASKGLPYRYPLTIRFVS